MSYEHLSKSARRCGEGFFEERRCKCLMNTFRRAREDAAKAFSKKERGLSLGKLVYIAVLVYSKRYVMISFSCSRSIRVGALECDL